MVEPLRLMLWHWGRRGGGPRYTMELARVLKDRPGLQLYLSLSRQSELFEPTDQIGIPSCHVDTYRDLPSFLTRSMSLPFIRAHFLSYLKQHRIDVVYNTLDFLWGAAIAPAIRRTNALYLLAVHDAERHSGEDAPWRRWLLRRDIVAADGAITMTNAVREQLIALHGFPQDRTWTAPLGIHLSHLARTPRELPTHRPVRLLFYGRILPYKGLDILLKALPLIRLAHPSVELEIWGAGDVGPYQQWLRQTASVRLENRWLTEDEIPAIFERTDVCVLPYREASQSGVIASAMAAGMPVVTTPVAGIVEQIDYGNAGRISVDFSVEGFAQAATAMLSDANAYREMSKHAISLSNTTLSWASIGDRVEQAVRRLAELGARKT